MLTMMIFKVFLSDFPNEILITPSQVLWHSQKMALLGEGTLVPSQWPFLATFIEDSR